MKNKLTRFFFFFFVVFFFFLFFFCFLLAFSLADVQLWRYALFGS